jgi:hypothetical protein
VSLFHITGNGGWHLLEQLYNGLKKTGLAYLLDDMLNKYRVDQLLAWLFRIFRDGFGKSFCTPADRLKGITGAMTDICRNIFCHMAD